MDGQHWPAFVVLTDGAESAIESDDLDYREIYQELRSTMTLRTFVERLGSKRTIGFWSKYEREESELSWSDRNELRAAVGLPSLPTPRSHLGDLFARDATIWQVGPENTGAVICAREKLPELVGALNLAACIADTKPVKRKGLEGYRDLFDAPPRVLAFAVRNRVEVDCG